jgi:Glycosyltransferase sugar-binding region containing DXD motif
MPHRDHERHPKNNVVHRALKDFKTSSSQRQTPFHSLTGGQTECGEGQERVDDILLPETQTPIRTIPHLFHQTSVSRCLTPSFFNLTVKWKRSLTKECSYLFHDQEAVGRLLKKNWKEFGLLTQVLTCVSKGTIEADLWRYLVLYEYGGLYSDIDSAPNGFTMSMLQNQNALFLVDQYDMLSEFFFAAAPKHPLLFYTIHHALQRILDSKDTGTMYPGRTTGPHALLAGFRSFQRDVGLAFPIQQPVQSGTFRGKDEWTVTIIGIASNEHEFVIRQAVTDSQKLKGYQKMGITYYLHDLVMSNRSCSNVIHEGNTRRVNTGI